MPFPIKVPKPKPRLGAKPLSYPRRPLPPYRPNRQPPWKPKGPKPFNFGAPLRKAKPFGKRIAPALGGRLARKGLARLALRAVPGLGVLLLANDAYDLYRWWKDSQWQRVPDGYYKSNDCGLNDTHFKTLYQPCGGSIAHNPPFNDVVGSGPGTIGAIDITQKHPFANRYYMAGHWSKLPAPEYIYIPPGWQPYIDPDAFPAPALNPLPWELLPHGVQIPGIWEHVSPPQKARRPRDKPRYLYRPNGRTQDQQQHKYRRNTKEKKGKYTSWAAYTKMREAFHALTEYGDFIDALYDALPKHLKFKKGYKPTPYDKTLAVLRHFDEISLQRALANILNNEAGDYLAGKAGKFAQHVAGITDGVGGSGFKLYNSPLKNLGMYT